MMQLNPIIKRDLEMRSRRLALPAALVILNSLLFLIGLLGTFGVVSEMQGSCRASYGAMLQNYALVTAAAFLLILLISPLLTAGSISGERESGTFDLLMTTRLTPGHIIVEKTLSAALSAGAIAISTWPALLLPLLFGGVGIGEAAVLLLLMLPGAFLMLCIGMFSSAASYGSVRSTALTYGIGLALLAGTILVPLLMRPFMTAGGNVFAYLLAANPLLPCFSVLSGQLGSEGALEGVMTALGLRADPSFLKHAALIGLLLQVAFSMGLLLPSVLLITPGRRLGRQKHNIG